MLEFGRCIRHPLTKLLHRFDPWACPAGDSCREPSLRGSALSRPWRASIFTPPAIQACALRSPIRCASQNEKVSHSAPSASDVMVSILNGTSQLWIECAGRDLIAD
jgi:hypothetical protein